MASKSKHDVGNATGRSSAEDELQAREELQCRSEAQSRERQKSEEEYRLLAEHATDMISRHGPDAVFLYASPACRTLLGYEPEELVGRSPFDLVHPDDLAATRAAHQEAMRDLETYTVNCRSLRKDGSQVWLEITCKSIRDPRTRAVSEIVAVSRDVSERIRAEQNVQHHLDILRAVMDGTTDAVFVKDLAGKYLTINQAGAGLVGKTVESVLGKDDKEIFSPESARQIMEGDQRIMSSGRTLTYEEVVTASGITRTYSATKGPYRDAQGNVIGLIGISRDITERKQAEEAVQKSEAKVRAILEAFPDAMFRVRRDGTLLEFQGAKGFSPSIPQGEFQDKRIEEVLPPQVVAACMQLVADALDRDEVQQLEYDLSLLDGTHDYEARFVALGHDEVLAIVRDVTERKRAEAQVRQLLGDLSRAARMTTVGELASGLAHELNQPLMAITNYASAATNLLDEPRRLPDLVSCLARLKDQAQTAAEIIRRVRHFVSRREPRLSSVDVNALVRAAVDLDRSWLSDDGTRIELDLAGGLPLVQADQVLLQQVVINLIRNAREAMAEMPVAERQIALATSLSGRKVKVAVRDRGPGIPSDVAAHLFEPFRTTKPQGLGLGLSLSRSIIEAHHGRLDVERHAEGGSTFWFVLPLG